MKKFEKPIVNVLLLEDVDVIATSPGVMTLSDDEYDPANGGYDHANSRGPWGGNPWDE